MGYFTEQNVLFNTRYMGKVQTRDGVVDGLLSSMSQETALEVQGFAFGYGVHRRMTQLGLNMSPHSRFLSEPAAQVLTSVRGRKRTFTEEQLKDVASRQLDGRWEPKEPGQTLHGLGNLRAASNFSFRSGKLVKGLATIVGFGLGRADALFKTISFPKKQTPESLDKVKRWCRINSAFDHAVRQLHDPNQPLDELLDQLGEYEDFPLPGWWDEHVDLDARLTELISELSNLGLDDTVLLHPDIPRLRFDILARQVTFPDKGSRRLFGQSAQVMELLMRASQQHPVTGQNIKGCLGHGTLPNVAIDHLRGVLGEGYGDWIENERGRGWWLRRPPSPTDHPELNIGGLRYNPGTGQVTFPDESSKKLSHQSQRAQLMELLMRASQQNPVTGQNIKGCLGHRTQPCVAITNLRDVLGNCAGWIKNGYGGRWWLEPPEPVSTQQAAATSAAAMAAVTGRTGRKARAIIDQGGLAYAPTASLSSSEEEQSDTSAEDTSLSEGPESGDSSSDRPGGLWPPPHSIAPPLTAAPPTPPTPSEVDGLSDADGDVPMAGDDISHVGWAEQPVGSAQPAGPAIGRRAWLSVVMDDPGSSLQDPGATTGVDIPPRSAIGSGTGPDPMFVVPTDGYCQLSAADPNEPTEYNHYNAAVPAPIQQQGGPSASAAPPPDAAPDKADAAPDKADIVAVGARDAQRDRPRDQSKIHPTTGERAVRRFGQRLNGAPLVGERCPWCPASTGGAGSGPVRGGHGRHPWRTARDRRHAAGLGAEPGQRCG